MIWRALSRSSAPAAEGHPDYFATEAHYLSVAHRILAALHTGGFVCGNADLLPQIKAALAEAKKL